MRALRWIVGVVFALYVTQTLADSESSTQDTAAKNAEYDALLDKFVQWADEQNIKRNGVEVMKGASERMIKQYGSPLRGVQATTDLQRNEIVVRVPESAVLSAETALDDEELGPIFANYAAELPSLETGRTPLAVFLMVHKNKGDKSKWAPYLNLIPRDFNAPMLWKRTERAELKGTWVLDRVLADMEGLMSEYDQIFTQRLFEDHPEKFPEDKYTIEDFMWAWSVIWGRSVDLQYVHHPSGMNFPDDMEVVQPTATWTSYLIPFIDLVNHPFHNRSFTVAGSTTTANTESKQKYSSRVIHIPESAEFQLIVNNTYAAGEQLFRQLSDSQSAIPNIDLVRKYGFLDPGNPLEITSIKLALDKGDNDYKEKMAWLRTAGVNTLPYPYSEHFIGSRGIPQSVAAILRVHSYQINEEQRKYPSQLPSPIATISNDNERQTWNLLKIAIDNRMDKFKTTIEQDELLLENPDLPYRTQLAIEIRLEEKMALSNAKANLREQKISFGKQTNDATFTMENVPAVPIKRAASRASL